MYLGHAPPRGTEVYLTQPILSNPSTLSQRNVTVVFGRGRVSKPLKIFMVHGFAFETGTINLHVSHVYCRYTLYIG